ncbi:nuclear transport factor 2 family protein [Dankookia sp. GCM10030260]|uniref:nuclear transport factor 2 family protein n=1 Tax=Dankookia sp. GCM10030260 TaxID=3273390 RepID=UPI00360FFF0E
MGDDPAAALTRRSRARQADLYAQYAGGNRAAVLDALADDVLWTSVAAPGIPWAGTHRGRAGVEAYFAAIDGAARITGYAVERVIADGEWVTVLARARALILTTGAEIEIAKADVIRLCDGRIQEFREHYDTAAVQDALRAPAAR